MKKIAPNCENKNYSYFRFKIFSILHFQEVFRVQNLHPMLREVNKMCLSSSPAGKTRIRISKIRRRTRKWKLMWRANKWVNGLINFMRKFIIHFNLTFLLFQRFYSTSSVLPVLRSASNQHSWLYFLKVCSKACTYLKMLACYFRTWDLNFSVLSVRSGLGTEIWQIFDDFTFVSLR